jgi:glycosyltransferase involved in cell wall biosynthesis
VDAAVPQWALDACDRNNVLFVGRFDLTKGADVLLKAFLLVLSKRPNLKLTFVGPDRGWVREDGSSVQFAAYLAALFPVHLRDRVEYLGPLDNREVAKLRARSMVTVVASRWENQSYALLEAMSQGCPVVSTDAGGCPESVIDGVTGRLAKSGVPEDFAAQIDAMLDDPQRAESMGRAARRHVLEHHSAGKIVDNALVMYQRVISRHHDF